MTLRNGFTLIELILVMALIGILSVIGIGSYTQATVKSRDTQRKSDLNQIAKALEMYNNDVGSYPKSNTDGEMLCLLKNGTDGDCLSKIYAYTSKGDEVVYMEDVPEDPESDHTYRYEYNSGSFALYAALENTEDRDIVVDSSGKQTDWGVTCGSVKCNYKLTELGLVRAQ